jgi:hypothetical protein
MERKKPADSSHVHFLYDGTTGAFFSREKRRKTSDGLFFL